MMRRCSYGEEGADSEELVAGDGEDGAVEAQGGALKGFSRFKPGVHGDSSVVSS